MRYLIYFCFIVVWFHFGLLPKNCKGGWLVYHKPEFRGKVINAESKEPIEGLVVVVVYYKTVIRWAVESFDEIKHIQETLTSKDGTFTIPSYTSMTDPLSFDFSVEFIMYKPGYGSFPDYQKVPIGITRGDHEEFFSKEIGSEGELDLWRKLDNKYELKRCKVKFVIVELPELKTLKERERCFFYTDRIPPEFKGNRTY